MSDARYEAISEISRIKRAHDIGDDEILDREELRLLREGHGHPGAGDSAGERFAASASFAAWRDGMADAVAVPVAEADELISMAAALDFVDHPIERFDVNAVRPRHSPLDLVEVVPAVRQVARSVSLDGAQPVGWGVPGTAASVEVELTADGEDVTLIRWAGHGRGRRSHIVDDAFVRRLVDRVLVRGWFRALAAEVLIGDGSETASRVQLRGIANTVGISSAAVDTGDYTGALLGAVAAVEGAGFPGPHVAIMNPADKASVLGHDAWRGDRFPTLGGIVGFDLVPSGSGFVGQAGAASLYSTGLAVEVAIDHAGDYTTGQAVLQPAGYVLLEVPQPGAFCEITAM